MIKIATVVTSFMIGLWLAGFSPAGPPEDDGPPPQAKGKEKDKRKGDPKKGEPKKGEPGPKGDLTRAYDLLRRLRAADGTAGRPEERIRDWTERASKFYRDGLKALDKGDDFLAHEYGAIAHDLARAADHAHNAAMFDRKDPELPPPPERAGPEDSGERARRDLHHAYDRITEAEDGTPNPDAGFAKKASRDLYTAARRDVEAGREERGGELARAAEAMTHVTEHLGHVADGPPKGGRPAPPEPKAKAKEKKDKEKGKGKGAERRDSDLPPPLPPE